MVTRWFYFLRVYHDIILKYMKKVPIQIVILIAVRLCLLQEIMAVLLQGSLTHVLHVPMVSEYNSPL
jgi:hypothetical protein